MPDSTSKRSDKIIDDGNLQSAVPSAENPIESESIGNPNVSELPSVNSPVGAPVESSPDVVSRAGSSDGDQISEVAVIHGGLLFNLLGKVGLSHAAGRTGQLCFLFVALTWLPMLILASVQGVAFNPALKIPFLYDLSEMSRFLVCGPILILSEKMVEPWLRSVVNQFRALVPESDIPQFEKFLASAHKARELMIVEIILLAFALTRPHFDSSIALLHNVPSWQTIGDVPSWAQTYSMFIAKPLMGWLWLRWLYKYAVWSLLLVRFATLNLRLIPTHPDDTAGLGFVAVGQTKFHILAIGFSTLGMGAVADEILFEGAQLMTFKWLILLVVCLSLVIFATPLLAFTPKLIEVKRRGLFEYGKLAQEYVSKFDEKWIENREGTEEEILGHADVQTLADMENAYAVVQRMKVIIIDRAFLTTFALSAALPFAPLLLTMYQLDDLLDRLFKNVF